MQKKKKTLTIRSHEGHGKKDDIIEGDTLKNISVCRFKFPKFPLNETRLVRGCNKDLDEEEIKSRKNDLNKIVKFLIRQTHTEKDIESLESWKWLKQMDFWQFLLEVGMFTEEKNLKDYSESEKQMAKLRYLNAISVSIHGSAILVIKRKVSEIFVNGYNKHVMRLHTANHDFSICIDPYAAGQYVCKYMTKSEEGTSLLLHAIIQDKTIMPGIEQINALAKILDKHREVSCQEAIYRLMGLNMTRSSVKVKFLSTIHPNFRDGLLKGNIENLSEGESIFHNSPHSYYESRPERSDESDVVYDSEELENNYWHNLSLAEFWSTYEVIYDKNAKKKCKGKKTKIQTLKNNKGYIRKRGERAVLRYYLNYNNDEDLARGLLVLFMPFRHEMSEIHKTDVKSLLKENSDIIQEKRMLFEKFKVMTDLISSIMPDSLKNHADHSSDDDSFSELESTNIDDIESFNKNAKAMASKDLSSVKNFTDLCHPDLLQRNISSLNQQQRKLFDDVTERLVSTDENEKPFYLFLTGNAGTGKSFLLNVLIDAAKHISIKPGDDLKKPPVIVMAPTANAARIIGGKTIDSVLCFNPSDANRYSQVEPSKLSMMKFQFEDVRLICCDEISMVGSTKLTKINFRFQDIAEGEKKNAFMGGVSFIASGKIVKRKN